MKSGAEFIADLKEFNPLIYCMGEKIEDFMGHPLLLPVINAARATYDLALDPAHAALMTTTSSLTGEKCSLLGTLFQSRDELVRTVKQRRWWHNTTGTCNAGRCAGTCVSNAIYNGTFLLDREYHTEYHQRFKEFYRTVQKEDKICAAGVMCVKGDRSKGPLGQEDPDLYLRVVDKNAKGIVVRGAKAHQSNGALAHEILVVPFRPMGEGEEDYAVSFAVPNGAPGLVHVWQHNLHDSRRLVAKGTDLGSQAYGIEYHGTCLTIFNDVFVPWERVFMCGEYRYTGVFVEKFADLIRMCGAGCRPGAVDLAMGVMALLAEYNGVEKSHHILDKITNIAGMNEVGYGCALAAAHEGEETASGLFFPNGLYVNAARLNGTLTFAEANKWLGDVAGGLIATMPSESDFAQAEIGPLLKKYLRGRADIPTEHRVRAYRFAEMLGSGAVLHGLLCGGGTTETQKMIIRRGMKLEQKKDLVKRLAGIKLKRQI
ncbi:MAG: hypothetical protein VR67_06595 [Peptococcaceae bacterium BRH_c8a]|nr:MAG: hypothetical protein VR67_06595 [Peptococcaceae bacterium BRH_c8a]